MRIFVSGTPPTERPRLPTSSVHTLLWIVAAAVAVVLLLTALALWIGKW
jgi:hypothetical protein